MDHLILSLLFDHMSTRSIVRLASCSKYLWQTLCGKEGLLIIHIAQTKCTTVWCRKRVSSNENEHRPAKHVCYIDAMRLYPCVTRGNFVFRPCPPKHSVVVSWLHNKLCRECLRPCTCAVTTVSGRRVIVCRECSRQIDGYSALCSRSDLFKINLESRPYHTPKTMMRIISELPVARRGGNRAYLYWSYIALKSVRQRCLIH